MKKLAGVLWLLLLPVVALAQPKITIGGLDQNGFWWPILIDPITKAAYTVDPDRDRDFSTLQSTGIISATLNAATSVQTVLPRSITQYTRGMLLISWGTATAADSDSVNVGITITGKLSQSSGNNYNFASAGSDTVLTPGASGGIGIIKPALTYYITRNSLTILNPGGGAVAVRIPLSIYKTQASTNGIALIIDDAAGGLAQFPFWVMTATNLHPRKNLTSFDVHYWPRVN